MTKQVKENGDTKAVLVGNGEKDKIDYFPSEHETYIDGVEANIDINEISEEIEEVDLSGVNDGDGIGTYAVPNDGSGLVYTMTYTYNVPVGTVLSTAISLISIWTKVPADKVKQSLMVVGLLYVSQLDSLLTVKVAQYRTYNKVQESYMCYPQYKWKNYSTLYYKGKNTYV